MAGTPLLAYGEALTFGFAPGLYFDSFSATNSFDKWLPIPKIGPVYANEGFYSAGYGMCGQYLEG